MNTESTTLVTESRAQQVENTIRDLQDIYDGSFLDICELLYEVYENKYFIAYGYSSLDEWLESSTVNISTRNAYYFIKVSKYARMLGLNKEQLKNAKISKIKEIFGLDIKQHSEAMRQMVIDAATETLDQVRGKVAKLKGQAPTDEPLVYRNFKLTKYVNDKLQDAIDLCRAQYGNTVNSEGAPVDISDNKAVELIAENYLQDKNNYPPTQVG